MVEFKEEDLLYFFSLFTFKKLKKYEFFFRKVKPAIKLHTLIPAFFAYTFWQMAINT